MYIHMYTGMYICMYMFIYIYMKHLEHNYASVYVDVPPTYSRAIARPFGCPCACGFGRTRTAPQCASTFRRRGARRRAAAWFGSQAFGVASAFNSNIGAWNTARVSDMSNVCAALGRPRTTAADALGRSSMRRGPLWAMTDARAHPVAVSCN